MGKGGEGTYFYGEGEGRAGGKGSGGLAPQT